MRLVGKFGLAAGALMLVGMASSAEAATILVANFCPQNNSCPTGVTQASLTIDDRGTPSVNDYLITATFTGTTAAPALLDLFSFTLGGVSTPTGYTSVSLTSATSRNNTSNVTTALPLGDFQTVFDNVSNSAGACTSSTNQANEVCTNSVTPAIGIPLAGNTLAFTFLADLAGALTIGNDLNLRAAFNNANGSNAGILSPNGNYTTGGAGSGNAGGSIPEPASMVLFGLAAFAAARRARRS